MCQFPEGEICPERRSEWRRRGRGGHIIFKATDELNTLLDLRYHREYHAQRGQHGMGKKMHGKDGEDLVIPVPVGTIIKDADTETVIMDLDKHGMETVIAKGGRGGLGILILLPLSDRLHGMPNQERQE